MTRYQIERLKVGDKVIIRNFRTWDKDEEIAEVEAVAKLSITAGGIKFTKRNGYAWGHADNHWHHPYLVEFNEENAARVVRLKEERRRDRMSGRMRRYVEEKVDWREQSYEVLEQVAKLTGFVEEEAK